MNILLDTHIFLWFITNNKRLADKYYDAISNQDNEIYLSNDPFDRLLLCQSLEHDLIIMTEDKAILSYPMVKFF